jgi:hypothetical protein
VAAKLIEEFDRMHRRTTEQFQQALLMMFKMHQDQMDLFRDELSRIKRLEDEHKALQDDIGRLALPQASRPALRLVSGEHSQSTPHLENSEMGESRPDPIETSGWTSSTTPATAALSTSDSSPPIASRQAAGDPLKASDPDPHARLAQRLAEIQDERQGLWKRILASFGADGSEKNLP